MRDMEVLQDGKWKITHHRSNIIKGRHWYQVDRHPYVLMLKFDDEKKVGYETCARFGSVKGLRRFLKKANRQLKPFLDK